MVNYAKHVSPKQTDQTRVIPGREKEMAVNNQGGFTFKIGPFEQLKRFLILGTEGGTYYANETDHTLQAFGALKECIATNSRQTVDMAVEVSVSGRAAKNDQALFVIACVMSLAKTDEEKLYARQCLSKVARIGTHILHFASMIDYLKGWGSGTRKAFKSWFLEMDAEQLAYQAIKYASRDGWSLRDLLRKSHPFGDEEQNAIFSYIAKGKIPEDKTIAANLPNIIPAVEEVKASTNMAAVIRLIKEFHLPREVIPTQMLNSRDIWEALIPHMGLTALIRNLGKIGSLGMLADKTISRMVVQKLTNVDMIRHGRIHPIQALNAFKVYSSGNGIKGSLSWNVLKEITEALEETFLLSFKQVEPTGKRRMICLDASASMTWNNIAGSLVNPREASACMALVTAKVESEYQMYGFSNVLRPINITAEDSLNSAIKKIQAVHASYTNCSLPMLFAMDNNLAFDSFEVYTDNETGIGTIHPCQALVKYRKKLNICSKLAVVGMTATEFSIADPKDPFMIDFVGFDSSAPAALSEFVKF